MPGNPSLRRALRALAAREESGKGRFVFLRLGVYIWNADESLELVSLLKKISPETLVVLGGPEVSHEAESNKICQIADFTIKGEGDFLFYEFCHSYFNLGLLPETKIISGALPDIKAIRSPYAYYTDEDIKNRVI